MLLLILKIRDTIIFLTDTLISRSIIFIVNTTFSITMPIIISSMAFYIVKYV